jgi:hypothetical protein
MTAAGCSPDSQASAATGGRATDHFQTETVPTARVWLRRTGRGSLQHRVCVQSNEERRSVYRSRRREQVPGGSGRCRSRSTCLSHWLMRFQLVKTRLRGSWLVQRSLRCQPFCAIGCSDNEGQVHLKFGWSPLGIMKDVEIEAPPGRDNPIGALHIVTFTPDRKGERSV